MTKSKQLLVVLLPILAIGGYFLYQYWQEQRLVNTFTLVPSHALLVVECEDVLTLQEDWAESKPWKQIKALPYPQTLLNRLDLLLRSKGAEDLLRKRKILASLHTTTSNDFDFLFFLPVGKENPNVEKVLRSFRQDPAYRAETRNFGGIIINEITDQASGTRFSFIQHKNVLIGSYTPFLVEDVIRTVNSSTKSRWSSLHAILAVPAAPVRIYVQGGTLSKLGQSLNKSALSEDVAAWGKLVKVMQLTLSVEKDKLRLKGNISARLSKEDAQFLGAFIGQRPQPIHCTKLIPLNTAVLYHWGFSNATQLQTDLHNYWALHEPETVKAQRTLINQYQVQPNTFFSWMDQELALAVLEENTLQPDQFLLAQTHNPTAAIRQLDETANRLAQAEGISAFAETYGDTPIRQLAFPEFPAAIWGNACRGFHQCFYAPLQGYIVFANDIQALKRLLEDIRTENVWDKSEKQKAYLKEMTEKANYTVLANTARTWPLLLQRAAPKWNAFLQVHQEELRKFERLAIQFRHDQKEVFHTQLTLDYQEETTATTLRDKFFTNANTLLDAPLRTTPTVVRNHLNKSRETLVQDISNHLYLISPDGQILWKKSLEGPIVSDIHQIDFLKNNKLQYLFATEEKLYILDRNGAPVAPFPVAVPGAVSLHTASVIDYENNRDYRFMVSDLMGNLYLYNKAGTLLEGWNPLRLGYRLFDGIRHIRIQDKDYLIATQANGIIQVLNRRGQAYKGFPKSTGARIHNPLFIESGISAEKTFVTTITDTGEIIRFNLAGGPIERKQLYRTSKESTFKLCPEARGTDWLVARQDVHTITILDKQGRSLFEKEIDEQSPVWVRYYDFGAGLQVVGITNGTEKNAYLYDLTGKQIGNKALPSNFPVAIIFVETFNKLLVYHGKDRQTSLVSIKIK